MGWAVTQGVNWWQCLSAIQLAFVEHMLLGLGLGLGFFKNPFNITVTS